MSTILIVDDQPHLRELLSQELMDVGHKVFDVGDAQSVSSCLADIKPDLVLLDLYLNGFEGWDVLHTIKEKDPNVSVLIVTAYDGYMDDPRISEADGYMIKSMNMFDDLNKKISDTLGQ